MTGHDSKHETSVAPESEPELVSLPVRGGDATVERDGAGVRAAPGENEMNSDEQSNLDASGLLAEPKDGAAVSLSLGTHPTDEEQEAATSAGVDDTTRVEHVEIPQPATAPSTPCSEGVRFSRGCDPKVIPDGSDLPVSFSDLREKAASFPGLPSIFRRSKVTEGRVKLEARDMSDCASKMDERQRIAVPGWPGDPTYRSADDFLTHGRDNPALRKTAEGMRQSVHKVARQKGVSSGRTYTSKYRGVHQTFPTRRWEAQFRRNGKPTSLGCFDHEEEAARAYDRMMVWCELHGQDSRGGAKGSGGHNSSLTSLPLNFDYGEYEGDFDGLGRISQDDLVQSLRRQGRLQAATNNAGGTVAPAAGIPASCTGKRKS